ncbi:MAG: hypothetical protein HY335_09680 [Deinococcus sp.]|nr:hypothetical protein [Deinococcus sp.]
MNQRPYTWRRGLSQVALMLLATLLFSTISALAQEATPPSQPTPAAAVTQEQLEELQAQVEALSLLAKLELEELERLHSLRALVAQQLEVQSLMRQVHLEFLSAVRQELLRLDPSYLRLKELEQQHQERLVALQEQLQRGRHAIRELLGPGFNVLLDIAAEQVSRENPELAEGLHQAISPEQLEEIVHVLARQGINPDLVIDVLRRGQFMRQEEFRAKLEEAAVNLLLSPRVVEAIDAKIATASQ